ncbi:hypothetical protein JOF56_011527 [Kibdelosporangium banguiense]|uniref:Uncharacterized protein n=1 Tax=Kibdelosporangium banguiense TaxID=1365924 RepID=A0ABS4U399_9PSEU|nr:hypothetical protein [Kibdelosporangium banguiense]MBP2331142.1 hypothetical protein [Kibdelosporangium banguiense]
MSEPEGFGFAHIWLVMPRKHVTVRGGWLYRQSGGVAPQADVRVWSTFRR